MIISPATSLISRDYNNSTDVIFVSKNSTDIIKLKRDISSYTDDDEILELATKICHKYMKITNKYDHLIDF